MIDAPEFEREVAATQNPLSKVRDVADFHLHWAEFRPIAERVAKNPALAPAEADTLAWMIELLNRIGPEDINPA